MARTKRTPAQAAAAADESKADKFKRLATARTNKAIAAIRGLGKLSSGQYERTPEQVNMIFEALGKEANEAMQKLLGQSKGKADSFTL